LRDRERFPELVQSLGPEKPHNGIAHWTPKRLRLAADIGFPAGDPPIVCFWGPRNRKIVRDQASLELVIPRRPLSGNQAKKPVVAWTTIPGPVAVNLT